MKAWNTSASRMRARPVAVAALALALWAVVRFVGSPAVGEAAVVAPANLLRVTMRGQRFMPARIVATVGDSVRFELESGGPHNIAFNADSIPPGARPLLARRLGSELRSLFNSEMLLSPGESFVLSLADLPPGTYPFYCAPHYGGGMRGELVVLARQP